MSFDLWGRLKQAREWVIAQRLNLTEARDELVRGLAACHLATGLALLRLGEMTDGIALLAGVANYVAAKGRWPLWLWGKQAWAGYALSVGGVIFLPLLGPQASRFGGLDTLALAFWLKIWAGTPPTFYLVVLALAVLALRRPLWPQDPTSQLPTFTGS
ncbi:MAG: hypothetical protein U0797_01010 [Gemmataceae bacterium]